MALFEKTNFLSGAAKDQEHAIVMIDDATREVKHVIKDERLNTPTGKFNVFNTRNDVY